MTICGRLDHSETPCCGSVDPDLLVVIRALFDVDRRVQEQTCGAEAVAFLERFNLPHAVKIRRVHGSSGITRIRFCIQAQVYEARYGPQRQSVVDADNLPVEVGRDRSRWWAVYRVHTFRHKLVRVFALGVLTLLPTDVPIMSIPAVEVQPIPKQRKTGAVFQQCRFCPQMVTIQASQRLERASDAGRFGQRPLRGTSVLINIEAVSRFEITFSEWDFFCASSGVACPHRPYDHGWGRGLHPVIDVTWRDAEAYAAWLHRLTGEEYRLPNAEEWEYIAQASSRSDLCGRPPEVNLDRYAWHRENSGGHSHDVLADTAQRMSPNHWGIYQMLGNVSEWVQDCWQPESRFPLAPNTIGDCPVREVRGGSWADAPNRLSCNEGFGLPADSRHRQVGFRLVVVRKFISVSAPSLKEI